MGPTARGFGMPQKSDALRKSYLHLFHHLQAHADLAEKKQEEYFQSRGHLRARTGSIGIAGKPRTFLAHFWGIKSLESRLL